MKYKDPAAFGRLCVETIKTADIVAVLRNQPPSGGCVLKLNASKAALIRAIQPPSGGCVLKQSQMPRNLRNPPQPPSGGCVLKQGVIDTGRAAEASRLRAAVC